MLQSLLLDPVSPRDTEAKLTTWLLANHITSIHITSITSHPSPSHHLPMGNHITSLANHITSRHLPEAALKSPPEVM